MADLIVMNGVTYVIPIPGDENWGQNVTDFLIAIPGAILQKSGGAFTLTADVNFGTPFGLISTYFKSHTTGIATAGVLRLAKTDTIDWLNNAGSGNNVLSVDGTDRLTYNSVPIIPSLADGHIFVGNISNVPTDVAMTGDVTITDLGVTAIGAGKIVNAQINASAAIAYSKLVLTGSIVNNDIGSSASIVYSKLSLGNSIVNADIATTAAIAYSKLAALTASKVLVSDGSGFVSASTVTTTTLGYLDATSSIQTQLNGKQATLTTGNLTDAGTDGIVVTGGTGAVIGTGTSLAQHVADVSHNGYLSSTDWSTFNTGASTAAAALPSASFTDAAVVGKLLTGYSSTTGTISSSTSIVGAISILNGNQALYLPLTGGTLTGDLTLANNHALILKETTGNGTDSVTLKAPASVTTSYTLTLPPAITGTSGFVLSSDTSGITSWVANGTGVVGAGTQYELPYYATAGTTLSAAANINYNAAGNFEILSGHTLQLDGSSSGSVSLVAPASPTTYTITLPTTGGTAGYVLSTNGSGTTSWITAGAGSSAFREDYIVGTPLNNYTGSTTVFNLVNGYTVAGNSLIVLEDGDVQTLGATNDYLETNSTTVTFNNALVVGEKVGFIFQTPTSSGGTINTGTAGQNAVYNGTNTITSGATMSMNGTKITNLANGTAATDAAAFGQIKLIQTVTFKTDTVTSTSSSSYQNTSLAVTITPTSASNRIKITVTGNLDNLVSTRQVLATIARGATNLGGVNGIATTFDTSGRIIVPCAMSIIDTPATTSATTYTVQVATPSGGAVSWGFVSCDQTIIAEEIV